MYTDGGCYNNGDRKGDGSYAFLFLDENNKDKVIIIGEYLQNTTNNRTEMLAAIEGIKYLQDKSNDEHPTVNIVSDSGYLVKGYTDPAYLDRWIANGWRTSNNKPVSNKDLWEELQRLSWHIGFNFIHIRGHMKDKDPKHAYWNDIVDKACSFLLQQQYSGYRLKLQYTFATKEFSIVDFSLVERRNDNGL